MPRRTDRGAIVPMVALMLTALVGVSAFAVDLGMQRVARRDMQALADVVALDLARHLDGRTASQIGSLQALADDSLGRNPSSLGEGTTVTPTVGTLAEDGSFQPLASVDEVPTAVQVLARTTIDFAFAGGSGGAARTAVAATTQAACFSLGSWAAGVDPTSSPVLDALVGDALDVTVVGYGGLAGTRVRLGDLAAELSLLTVEELAAATVSLQELYLAVVGLLRTDNLAQAMLLESVAALVDPDARVAIADVVVLDTSSEAALEARADVLDLVAGSAFLVNGEHGLALDEAMDFGPVGSGEVDVSVVQRPQLACGPVGQATAASTSQVMVTVRADLLATPAVGVPITFEAEVTVTLSQATGTLFAIECGDGTEADPEGIVVSTQTSLATVAGELRRPLPTAETFAMSGVFAPSPPSQSPVILSYPPRSYDEPTETDAGSLALLPSFTATPAGDPLTTAALVLWNDHVVPSINADVLAPLGDLLGLSVAGADVYGVPHPECRVPALRG